MTDGDLTRVRQVTGVLVSSLLLLAACGDSSGPGGGDAAAAEDCESCLAAGGTWQPEVSQCTESCDIQDISCFTDECPGACEDACENCFGQDECEAQGCTWMADAEAMFCSE